MARDFASIDAAKTQTDLTKQQQAIQALPPGYIQGFTMTLGSDLRVTLGDGVANVNGQQVQWKSGLITQSMWAQEQKGGGTGRWFFVYLKQNGDLQIDLTAPTFNSTYFHYELPGRGYRAIGKLLVDSSDKIVFVQNVIDLQTVFADLITFGAGIVSRPNYNPANGDNRVYLDSGSLLMDQYSSGVAAWQNLFSVDTGASPNLLDLFISGRLFARDSVLSALGRFWFASTQSASYGIIAIAYGDATWVAMNAAEVMTSSDGISWGSPIASPPAGALAHIGYGNGIFIIGDLAGHIYRSTDDGATWGSAVTNPFGGDAIHCLKYGNGVWLAMAGNGKLARSIDDGVSWGSLITNPMYTDSVVIDTAVYAQSVWLMGGNPKSGSAGYLSMSTDNGLTWSAVITNPIFGTIIGIEYGNNVFIAAGQGGGVARSVDGGLTWGSLITTPFTATNFVAPKYASGIWLLGNASGEVARSLDGGLTWGIRYGDDSTLTLLSGGVKALETDGSIFVIGGDDSGADYIQFSNYVEAGAGIVDSGSNSYGSWVKFANGSGYQETVAVQITCSTLWGSLYYGSVTQTWPVAPVSVIGQPAVHVSSLSGDNRAAPMYADNGSDLTTVEVHIFSVSTGNYAHATCSEWFLWK